MTPTNRFAFNANDHRMVFAMIRNGLSVAAAARELGVDKRMLAGNFRQTIAAARSERRMDRLALLWDRAMNGNTRAMVALDKLMCA